MNLDGQHEEEVKPGDSDSEESPEPEPYDGSNVCRKCHFPLKSSYRVAGKKGTKSIRHDRCACCVVFLTGCVCAGKVAQNARTLQIASSKPGTKTTKTNGIPSKSSSVFFVTSFSIVMESMSAKKNNHKLQPTQATSYGGIHDLSDVVERKRPVCLPVDSHLRLLKKSLKFGKENVQPKENAPPRRNQGSWTMSLRGGQ